MAAIFANYFRYLPFQLNALCFRFSQASLVKLSIAFDVLQGFPQPRMQTKSAELISHIMKSHFDKKTNKKRSD